MAPIHLLIHYETSGSHGVEYEVVKQTYSHGSSTYIEDNETYMYNDVPIKHPISNQDMTLKVRMTREEGLKNLVVKAFDVQRLCEAALSRMVKCEIQDRMPERKSFKMSWEYDPYKDQLPQSLRVRMMAGDGSTTWWDAVRHEMG
jgi:hypothetical protein